jgi:hypothetical protein
MEETGYLHNMTTKEKEFLKAFMTEVKAMEGVPSEMINSWYLLRFCRARKFDLKKTLEMFSNFIEWKTKNNLLQSGQIDMTQFVDIKKNYMHGYYHTDKQGRPVYIERVNGLNPKEMFKTYTDEQLIQYYIQAYDRLIHLMYPICSKVAGKRIEKSCTILDLKGVSVMSLFFGKTKAFVQIASKIGQDYYPEILGKMFILNSGWMFKGIWSVVKGWIDKKTQNKIIIVSGSGKKELLEHIDEDKLPDFLGGTCTDDLMNDPGPWQEERRQSIENKTIFVSDQELTKQYFTDPEFDN